MIEHDLSQYTLSSGKHNFFEDGHCAMELAAHLAGEPHTDSPECTSRVIAAYVRTLQDLMPDDVRNEMILPRVPRLLGTRGADSQRLANLCADRAVRVFAVQRPKSEGLAASVAHASDARTYAAEAYGAGTGAAAQAAARAAGADAAWIPAVQLLDDMLDIAHS